MKTWYEHYPPPHRTMPFNAHFIEKKIGFWMQYIYWYQELHMATGHQTVENSGSTLHTLLSRLHENCGKY